MRNSRNSHRRLRFGRLALVLIGVTVSGGAVYGLHAVQTRRNAGSILARAEQAAAAGDLPTAAGHYRGYLKLRPADADATAHYAAVLDGMAKTKPAVLIELIQTYEKLLRVDPTRADERRKLARLHLRTQAYPNARSHLATLFAAGMSDDPELHDLLAQCDEGEQKFPAAADHLRTVVATDTAAPDAYLRLANIVRSELGGADALAEADGLMDALVRKRPTDPKAWLARTDYRRRFGDKTGAKQDAEYAYNTLPGGADDPDVSQALADLYLETDDLRGAERVLQKVVAGGAGRATQPRLTLADVQLRLGGLDPDVSARPGWVEAARRTLREAAEAATAADVVLLEVVDRLIDLNELAAAEKQIERLSALPGVGDYLRGRLRLAAGEWAAATPLLRAAADGLDRLTNQRFRAFLGLADAAAQANDTPARLAAYEGALRMIPAAPAARLGRAECLAKLGRHKEAEEAFQELTAQSPVARATVAGLRLSEQMVLPAAERRWEAVDVACGPDPLPAEVAVVKAKSLVARGRAADAVTLLDEVTGRSPLPEPVVELATLKAALGDRAGAFAVLDRAGGREVGDRVEFRLARARLLAQDKPVDWAAVATVGRPAALGQLPADERYTLLAGLAEVFAGGGRRAEAIDLWKRAAAEKPTDLVSRAALFNLALATADAPLQAELIAEFERVEGPDGPVRATAEAAQAVTALKPGDPAIVTWKDSLLAVRAKRPGWGLVPLLLGRLEELAGNADAAAEAYGKAFELGERSEGLVRSLYAALLGRQRYAEAFDVLGKVAREKPLADDLAKELRRLEVAFGDDPARAVAWAYSAEAAASGSDRDQVLRADALLAAGRTADAIAPLKKAVGLNPKNAVAWVALTRLLVALGKDVEAKSAADAAVASLAEVQSPPADRAAALTAAGACRELTGDRAAAEATYRDATAADPAGVAAQSALVRLLARSGRPADAETHLRDLSGSAPPAVRRWARRELAFANLDRSDWYGRLAGALALVEQNLTEGGGLPEDVRAKAVLLGTDPFRVDEAVGLLADSAQQAPHTADQAYQLARLYLRQGQPAKAEATLRDATRSAPVPPPELLGLLVKVQADAKLAAAARRTFDRLRQLDPKAPETGVAEARVLAAEGKPSAAADRLAAVAGTADPAAVAAFAGPLLEEMNCPAEAEAVYRRATGSTAPLRLAAFYLRNKRPEQVVRTLLQGDDSTPVGLAARLLAGAVRSRLPQLVPEAERANWEAITREVTEWVQAKLATAPADPHLLAAAATLTTVGGDPAAVVPAYERALAAAPNDPTAKANLAFARAVYARDGTDPTLALIQSAIDTGGPAPALLDTRGLVQVAAGRAEPAIRDLSAAFALDPKPAYAFHLAQAYDLHAGDRAESRRLRDETLKAAEGRGLTRAVLDPREWDEYERLTKPAK